MTWAGESLQALAEAHDWCEALGHETRQASHCRLVLDREHPELWSGNHASGVRASEPPDIERTLAEIEAAFAYSRYRVVDVDGLTPPTFVARLALEEFEEQPAVILMTLGGALAPVQAPPITISAVASEDEWSEVRRLLELDHAELSRGGRADLTPEVTRGIFANFRVKAEFGGVFLARWEGRSCAYAAAIPAPGDFGLVDDLFTVQSFRRRGIASAMVRHCIAHLRGCGSETVFLTARAADRPKRLYARLGFRPAMLARRYVKRVG